MRWQGGQALLGEGAGREVQSPWKAVGLYLLPSPRTRTLLPVMPAKAWVHMFTEHASTDGLGSSIHNSPKPGSPQTSGEHTAKWDMSEQGAPK